MGLELLRKATNRNIYLGVIYREMIVNTLGIDMIVKGDHVSWKLEKDLQQS